MIGVATTFFIKHPKVGYSRSWLWRRTTAAPKWIAIDSLTVQNNLNLLGTYLECVAHAIHLDHSESDAWQATYMAYAIRALAEDRYYAALTFAEMMLIEPNRRGSPRLAPDGPEAVTLAALKQALSAARARTPQR